MDGVLFLAKNAPLANPEFNRELKNKHPAVSQGGRRFEKRSIFIDM